MSIKSPLCLSSATWRGNACKVLCPGSAQAQNFAWFNGSWNIRAAKHNIFRQKLKALNSQQILVFTDGILSRTQMALGVAGKIVAKNLGSNK